MYSTCGENSFNSARKSRIQRERALNSIYEAGLLKIKRKKPRVTLEECNQPIIMLKNDTVPKTSLSPFNPLPAIGKMAERKHNKSKETKVLVFDITKDILRPSTIGTDKVKMHDVLKPLSPLRTYRKSSSESLNETRPQQLQRENTYDLIQPIFLSAPKMKKRDSSLRTLAPMVHNSEIPTEINNNTPAATKISPRARFKQAAIVVGKLGSVPETGKLLCLRQRETRTPLKCDEDQKEYYSPVSPTHRLNKLSEIFQNLDVNGGRHRDKMKKENNWF